MGLRGLEASSVAKHRYQSVSGVQPPLNTPVPAASDFTAGMRTFIEIACVMTWEGAAASF